MIQFLYASNLKEILDLQERCNFLDGWSKENFSTAFLRQDFFVLGKKIEDRLVGYISFTISFDTADVELVLVDKDFRGRGIAKELLTKALKEIKDKNVSKVLLEVRKDNDLALSLYKGNGFSQINVRKKYYEDWTDALILAKELV